MLVVEPDRFYREFLAGLGRAHGLEVELCDAVADAIRAIDRDAPDVVVCELDTADGGADRVIAAARARGLHMPFLVIANAPTNEHAERLALDDCCSVLLTRPIDLDVFANGLRAADERRHDQDCVHVRRGPVPDGMRPRPTERS